MYTAKARNIHAVRKTSTHLCRRAMSNGFFYRHSLDRSISNIRGVWLTLIIIIVYRKSFFYSSASDLGLHCLPVPPPPPPFFFFFFLDAMHKWVNSLDRFITNRRDIWFVFIITILYRNSWIQCKQCRVWSGVRYQWVNPLRQSHLLQMTFWIMFLSFFRENKTWHFMYIDDVKLYFLWKLIKKQEAHGPGLAHLSEKATADTCMQNLCSIFPILSLHHENIPV